MRTVDQSLLPVARRVSKLGRARHDAGHMEHSTYMKSTKKCDSGSSGGKANDLLYQQADKACMWSISAAVSHCSFLGYRVFQALKLTNAN